MTLTEIILSAAAIVSSIYLLISLIMSSKERADITKAMHERLDELENSVANLETELRSRKN